MTDSGGSSPGQRPGHRWLLVCLVVVWAVSWPMVKIGVTAVSPLWYGAMRYAVAAGCLLALAAARRAVVLPPRPDWPLVLVSALLQMAVYSALTGLALTRLPPGRASVLAFSTPVWVVPLAAVWLQERMPRVAMAGVAMGLAGVVTIAAPSLQRHGGREIVAYGLLMAAAGAWAVSIVFVRGHRFATTVFALAPSQMTIAALALAVVALLAEGAPPAINMRAAISLAYVGTVATAFAYWAVVEAGRHFRASTISMALLATPSLGILISSLVLGERIDPPLVVGVLLTAGGIAVATRAPADIPTAPLGARQPLRESIR